MNKYRVVTKTNGFMGVVDSDHNTLEEAIEKKDQNQKEYYKAKSKIYTVEVIEKLSLVKI